jgi:hypothetical protein
MIVVKESKIVNTSRDQRLPGSFLPKKKDPTLLNSMQLIFRIIIYITYLFWKLMIFPLKVILL